MLKYLKVIGKEVHVTSKKTEVTTLCLLDPQPPKNFEGENVYRFNLFNADFSPKLGDQVIGQFGRFGDLDDVQNELPVQKGE